MTVVSNTTKKGGLTGRKATFIFAIISAVAAAILVLAVMSVVTAKETYYVLNADVPARTLITPQMLEPVETSVGGTPPAALGFADLADKYTLFDLEAGDILTNSNVGDLVGLSAGLPENYVVASFLANPSIAAGGNIKRGDYIDIIALTDDTALTGAEGVAASYLLQRVLVIDATVDLDTFDGASTEEGAAGTTGDGTAVGGSAARSGIPTMFTVGLSPEDAAVLAIASTLDLYVVLSSVESSVDGKVPTDTPAVNLRELWGAPRDAGKGTDNTFSSKPKTSAGEEVTDEEVSTPDVDEPSSPEDGSSEEPTEEPTEEGTEG